MCLETLKLETSGVETLHAMIDGSPFFDARQNAWIKSVTEFYQKFFTDKLFRQDVLDVYEETGNMLCRVPVILAVFPAGQLSREYYDPTQRRIAGWERIIASSTQPSGQMIVTEAYHDIPDFDYIVIVDTADDVAKEFLHGSLSQQYAMAKEIIWNDSLWENNIADIAKRFSKCNFRPGVPKPLPPELYEASVMRFVAKKQIDYSLANIIPRQVYEHIPYLIRNGDYRFLNCLRDFMMGMGDPFVKTEYKLDDSIQRQFRNNVLLRMVADGNHSIDQVILQVCQEIHETLPERPAHQESLQLVDRIRSNWERVVQETMEQGLIIYDNEGYISVTEQGLDKLHQLYIARSEFLQ